MGKDGKDGIDVELLVLSQGKAHARTDEEIFSLDGLDFEAGRDVNCVETVFLAAEVMPPVELHQGMQPIHQEIKMIQKVHLQMLTAHI